MFDERVSEDGKLLPVGNAHPAFQHMPGRETSYFSEKGFVMQVGNIDSQASAARQFPDTLVAIMEISGDALFYFPLVEIIKLFGGKEQYLAAVEQLESELYRKVA